MRWLGAVVAALLVTLAATSASAQSNGYSGGAQASSVTLGGDVTGPASANQVSAISSTGTLSLSPNAGAA